MPIYRITRELIDEVSSGFASLHALNLSHNRARAQAARCARRGARLPAADRPPARGVPQ